ncbi:Protein of unknown function (DUF1301) [Nesidiocoris tenuis]|uniref:Transmembrane protein 70 homolog, mitochondrial n=1 Tax=Nesidiocoris tenuis TaxID=355587 RepID=A0ABN7BEA3_9HEMI|nr:Protein of unknown function (DUF1301) [Nesidiocoris tenuis]
MSLVNISRLAKFSWQSLPRYHLSRVSSIRFRSSAAERPTEREPKIYKTDWIEEVKNPKENEELIYSGPLSGQIRRVKLFSLLTSVAGICSQPVIIQRAAELEASSTAIAATCSVVGFFTFVTPLLLHGVTKKYVTSVSYDSAADAYTATVYSFLMRKRQIRFKPGEAEIPDVSGFASAKVRGIPLFMDSRYFSDVYHYKRIMGFDKPMDFKLAPKKELT